MRQRGGTRVRYPPPGGVPISHNALQHFPECHEAAGGVPGSGTPPGGYPGQVRGGYPGQVPPPRGGGTRVGQQKEYSLHGGRYASCVHAGGLSCIAMWTGRRYTGRRLQGVKNAKATIRSKWVLVVSKHFSITVNDSDPKKKLFVVAGCSL